MHRSGVPTSSSHTLIGKVGRPLVPEVITRSRKDQSRPGLPRRFGAWSHLAHGRYRMPGVRADNLGCCTRMSGLWALHCAGSRATRAVARPSKGGTIDLAEPKRRLRGCSHPYPAGGVHHVPRVHRGPLACISKAVPGAPYTPLSATEGFLSGGGGVGSMTDVWSWPGARGAHRAHGSAGGRRRGRDRAGDAGHTACGVDANASRTTAAAPCIHHRGRAARCAVNRRSR